MTYAPGTTTTPTTSGRTSCSPTTSGGRARPKSDTRVWLVDILYVRHEARGQGIGAELIRAAVEYIEPEADMLALRCSSRTPARSGSTTGSASRTSSARLRPRGDARPAEAAATIGFVHVQNDDVEKVKRDAAKVLRREPELKAGDNGWTRVAAEPGRAAEPRARALVHERRLGCAQPRGRRRRALRPLRQRRDGRRVPLRAGVLRRAAARRRSTRSARTRPSSRASRTPTPRACGRSRVPRPSPAELPPAQELYEQIADVLGVQP